MSQFEMHLYICISTEKNEIVKIKVSRYYVSEMIILSRDLP